MSDRDELMALRRLAELEAKAGTKAAPALFGKPTPPADPKAAVDYVKQHSFGSGIPRLAYEAGGAVTDALAGSSGRPFSPMDLILPAALKSNPVNPLGLNIPPEVAGGAGTLANFLTLAAPSFGTSAKPGPAETHIPNWMTWPARKLMQKAVKPSATAGKDGPRAINTMLEEGIYPTSSGMEKASQLARGLDDQVDNLVAGSDAQVGVAAIGSRLKDVHQKAMTQVNPQSDIAAVRAAWDEFKTSPLVKGKAEIPVQLAHKLKKGTYASLGGKSYGEVGSAATEAQKALARGAREEVAEAVPAVKPLLERQANLMNVKDVAGQRALIESNKNPLGLAALRMDNPLSAATFMADRWAALKAFMALQMNSGVKPEVMVPFAMAATNTKSTPALLKELGIE